MSLVPTVVCTPDEARALTSRIQATHGQLWSLIAEAHDREAWRALGYGSFSAYVDGELEVGRSRAYQLIDEARVVGAIVAAAPEVSNALDIGARATQELKPHLELLQENVTAAVAKAEPKDRPAAARRAVAQTRAAVRPLPAAPAPVRRSPIPQQISRATIELTRILNRVEKLMDDDRFDKDKGQDLARRLLREQLARAADLSARAGSSR